MKLTKVIEVNPVSMLCKFLNEGEWSRMSSSRLTKALMKMDREGISVLFLPKEDAVRIIEEMTKKEETND